MSRYSKGRESRLERSIKRQQRPNLRESAARLQDEDGEKGDLSQSHRPKAPNTVDLAPAYRLSNGFKWWLHCLLIKTRPAAVALRGKGASPLKSCYWADQAALQ